MDAIQDNVTLEPEDLNPTDRAILDELKDGRSTPAFIAEKHGYTAGNVRNRMTSLSQHEHVRSLGGGMYELVDDPRGDVDVADEDELRGRLQDVLEERDDAQAKAERLREELDDCQELLDDARGSSDIEVDVLRRAIEDAEAAAERGDGAGLQDALDRAKGAIHDE